MIKVDREDLVCVCVCACTVRVVTGEDWCEKAVTSRQST